ncbi:MAG: thioredoxin family protein [Acidobacteria bacterium]|nr:thioredoxin family protein [Acidobacteriota bacterium]
MQEPRLPGRSGPRATTPGSVAAACLFVWLIAAGSAAAGGQSANSDTLEWLDDYEAALALAQETGRPLLVEFRCAP